MKKSIVILIGAIYILSIIFIGFFGMKMTSYNETIYPEKIEIESVEGATLTKLPDNSALGQYLIRYEFKDGASDQENVFSIIYHVYPDTTTDRTVSFTYDKNNSRISQIDERNNVWVTSRGGMTITISANARPTINVTFYLLIV